MKSLAQTTPNGQTASEFRVGLIGEWFPAQVADVLALQRAEEPETTISVLGGLAIDDPTRVEECGFDLALSTGRSTCAGWHAETLWIDTLSVAVAMRSPILGTPVLTTQNLDDQCLISIHSDAEEPWQPIVSLLSRNSLRRPTQRVENFGMALALAAAGYGVVIAPTSRLEAHRTRGIATRVLSSAPTVATVQLFHLNSLTEPQARFVRRARSMGSTLAP